MFDLTEYNLWSFSWEQFQTVALPAFSKANACIVFYRNAKIFSANQHFLNEFKYEGINLENVDESMWSYENERKRFLNFAQAARSGDKVENEEFIILNGNGEKVPVKIQIGTAQIENQEPVVGCIFIPLSQSHKDIDIQNIDEEEIFKAIAEQCLNGIVLITNKFQVVYMNPEALKIYGYNNIEETKNVPIMSTIAPECLPMMIERSKNWLMGIPNSTQLIYKIIRRDGEVRDLQVMTGEMYLRGNKYHLNTFLDITDLKKVEEALRDSEEKHRLIAETVPDIIVELDADLTFIWLNEEGYKYFGKNVLKNSILSFIPKKEELLKIMRGEQTTISFEFKRETRNKKEEYYSWIFKSMYNAKGEPKAILGSARDITINKMAEIELIEYQNQLRKLASQLALAEERERRRISSILHDNVGQLLALSKLKLEELLMSESFATNTVLNEAKELIRETIQHARLLTLDLSPPVLYEFGLEPAIERLLEQISNKNNIISSFKSDGKIMTMENDIRITLYRAVNEIFTNVVKHANAKHLNVRIQNKGNKIQINIEDDGVGFDIDSCFHNFSFSEKAGFGLFNIRERLSQLGGSFKCFSKVGHGTKIVLIAPLAFDEEKHK